MVLTKLEPRKFSLLILLIRILTSTTVQTKILIESESKVNPGRDFGSRIALYTEDQFPPHLLLADFGIAMVSRLFAGPFIAFMKFSIKCTRSFKHFAELMRCA